jgi:hypothetical protein
MHREFSLGRPSQWRPGPTSGLQLPPTPCPTIVRGSTTSSNRSSSMSLDWSAASFKVRPWARWRKPCHGRSSGRARSLDLVAKPLQELKHRDADLRKESVDIARNEQTDAHVSLLPFKCADDAHPSRCAPRSCSPRPTNIAAPTKTNAITARTPPTIPSACNTPKAGSSHA